MIQYNIICTLIRWQLHVHVSNPQVASIVAIWLHLVSQMYIFSKINMRDTLIWWQLMVWIFVWRPYVNAYIYNIILHYIKPRGGFGGQGANHSMRQSSSPQTSITIDELWTCKTVIFMICVSVKCFFIIMNYIILYDIIL